MQHHTSRAPIALILVVALVALSILAGVLAWLGWQFSLLPAELASALRVALFLLPVGAGILGGAIAWRRWASVDLLKADRIVALTQAQQQRFPSNLHSLSFHDSSKPQMSTTVDTPLALPAPEPMIPSFAQLLDAGKIGPGRPLLLGFDAVTAQPIEGSWRDLYSCGIGALQGAGKSWLAAFLLAQSAAAGGRLIVCDLHAGSPESLATRIEALSAAYMCDVATTPDQILAALKLAGDKLEQRKAGRGGAWPIIVAVDEWTSLLRTKVGTVLPQYLEDISEQGRKFNVNALLSAQGWTKDTAGVVRNRLTSHYVMRQRPDEARYQLGLPAGSLPLDVRFLPEAAAYLLDVRGALTKVIIPQMTSQDLARVGAMVAQPASAVGQPFGFQPVTMQVTPSAQLVTSRQHGGDIAVTSAAPVTTASISPEAARAADLFLAGHDMPAIVRELRGVVPREGRRYMTALAEVTDLVRQAMRGT